MPSKLKITDVMEDVAELQIKSLESKSISERKALGQFFTGQVVSDYMATLVNKPKTEAVRLLDAGAGAGILTASTALHCLNLGCKSVCAVLYETDKDILESLKQTLKLVQSAFESQGAIFTYEIHHEDFVLSRPDLNEGFQPFDVSVINPPYFKYSAQNSLYAKSASDLYHGDPNIYASFMAIVMSCMKDDGQMVSITPRSFTNGLYFKGFRSYLLSVSDLDLIHIFKRRDKVFTDDNSAVLQESIICRFLKRKKGDAITIRSSDCDAKMNTRDQNIYPVKLIIDPSNDQKLIRIPESSYDANILLKAEALLTTFDSAGYFISTGRVVEHRTREYITKDTGAPNSVPLYRPHNVTPLTTTWSGHHKKEVSFLLMEGHKKHTMVNGTYVLLKRFSSKDEKRRLVAGVHLASMHDCELIGFGNKTNYLGLSDGELTASEAYGLAAVFNSTFMDKYFRCISGNTQVNATEIRVMRFPSRDQVIEIGKLAQKLKAVSTDEIDMIVNPILGVMDTI